MLSVKEARKHERDSKSKRTRVMGRVALSHEPLLVKIGVRSWKAKSVPVGRSLARWAELSSAWERAVWGGGNDDAESFGGISGGNASSTSVDGRGGLCLREDIVELLGCYLDLNYLRMTGE